MWNSRAHVGDICPGGMHHLRLRSKSLGVVQTETCDGLELNSLIHSFIRVTITLFGLIMILFDCLISVTVLPSPPSTCISNNIVISKTGIQPTTQAILNNYAGELDACHARQISDS